MEEHSVPRLHLQVGSGHGGVVVLDTVVHLVYPTLPFRVLMNQEVTLVTAWDHNKASILAVYLSQNNAGYL